MKIIYSINNFVTLKKQYKMKRILIIILLFGLALNNYAQNGSKIKRDKVEAVEELIFQGLPIQDWLQDSTGASSVGANNGAYKDGSNIQLGTSPLIKNTDLPGASYNFNFGTSASRLNALKFWAANIGLESSGIIDIETNGVEWLWDGNYLKRQAFGRIDSVATLYEVRQLLGGESANIIQSSTFEYEFVGTTTDTRPGVNTFAFNSGIASSVTRINIDDFDLNNDDKSNLLQPVDTGSYLFLFNKSAQTWPNEEYLRYKITGGYVDATGYTKYNVSFIYDGGVDLAEGDVFVLQLDQSNSTGTGGFTSPIDTLTINDSLRVTEITSGGGDLTIRSWDGLSGPPGGDLDIIANDNILIESETASIDITVPEFDRIEFNSGTSRMSFYHDTIFADGSVSPPAPSSPINAKFKTGTFTNLIKTDTIISQGDTAVGMIDLKTAVEAESFDKLKWDTSLVYNDTITSYEFYQTVRKTLYPNDYASYLPNDSLYTTPSITLNIPTKVLIPTAVKYSRNWNLYDKGGGDFALRFEGADSSRFHITMTTSMRTSASNVVFEVFMYKNGVLEPGIAVERKIGTGADVGAISVTGAFDVAQNDYIEVFVLVDGTTTITFSKTSIIIKEDGLISN